MQAGTRRRAKIAQRTRAWVVVMRHLQTTRLPVGSVSGFGPRRSATTASASGRGQVSSPRARRSALRHSTDTFLTMPRQAGAGEWLGTHVPSPPHRCFDFYVVNSHAEFDWGSCTARAVALRRVKCNPSGLTRLQFVVWSGSAPRLQGVFVPPPSFPQAAPSVAGSRSGLPTTRTDDVSPRALAQPRGKTACDLIEREQIRTGGAAVRDAFGEDRTRRRAAVGTDGLICGKPGVLTVTTLLI